MLLSSWVPRHRTTRSRHGVAEVEIAELTQWIVQEHSRLIALLGMGGIGERTLASYLGLHVAPHFEAVLWRSVRDTPSCEDLVADCITFFSETAPAAFPTSLEQHINQLLARLQESRCLLGASLKLHLQKTTYYTFAGVQHHPVLFECSYED